MGVAGRSSIQTNQPPPDLVRVAPLVGLTSQAWLSVAATQARMREPGPFQE